MKTIVKLVSIVSVMLVLFSCGGRKDNSMSVQKEFFGVVLGQPVADVYNALKKQNFVTLDSVSSQKVRWTSNDSTDISFGGRKWTRFTTYFYNEKFGEIRFYSVFNDKDEDKAEAAYDELQKTLSGKYGEFAKVDSKKDEMLQQHELKCKDGKIVLSLQKLVAKEGLISNDYMYQVGLTYVLGETEQEAVDEL